MWNSIINYLVKFEILTGVAMNIVIFWVVMLCTLGKAQHFRRTYLLQDMGYLQIHSVTTLNQERTELKQKLG
jgi:hypothetical protein